MLAGVTGRTTGAIRRASGRARSNHAHGPVDRVDEVIDLTDDVVRPPVRLRPEQIAGTMHNGGLEVHYQPIVLMPSQQVVAFESLVRLRTDDGKLLEPESFIPVAESSGLILELGSAVLREALRQAARWRCTVPCLAGATVSVNVTPSQLRCERFPREVLQQLQDHDLPGSALTLEITESTAASDSVRPVLERFSTQGIRVALDDFGTGFANLDNLRRFPVQIIKLDRSFVAGVTRIGTERSIVRAVIDLAYDLGLSVVAEGVENTEQIEALSQLGCHLLQGFLLARPAAVPEALVTRLQGERPRRCPHDLMPDWGAEADAAVLAAVRMLARSVDPRRAAVHVLAARGARELGLPETTVRLTGRLALVHDVGRLAVDGRLPEALAQIGLLRVLADREPPQECRCVEKNLVDLALEVVRTADALDPSLGPDSLRQGLRALRERHHRDQAGCHALIDAIDRMIESPPGVPPLRDLLDHLDRRVHGRRGAAEHLRPLASVVRALTGSRDTGELLGAALRETRRIVGAGSVALERWDRGNGRLDRLAAEGGPLPGICGCFQDLMERSTLVFVADDPGLPARIAEELRRCGLRSMAHVPVELDGRPWGWIRLGTGYGQTPLCAGDIDMLTAVAALVGGAIDRAEHLDPRFRRPEEDPLTRVLSRRAAERALVEFARDGLPATLVLIDLSGDPSGGQDPVRKERALTATADVVSREMISWPGAVVGRTGERELCVAVPRSATELLGWLRGRLVRECPWVSCSVPVGTALGERGAWDARELLAVAAADLRTARDGTGRDPSRVTPGTAHPSTFGV